MNSAKLFCDDFPQAHPTNGGIHHFRNKRAILGPSCNHLAKGTVTLFTASPPSSWVWRSSIAHRSVGLTHRTPLPSVRLGRLNGLMVSPSLRRRHSGRPCLTPTRLRTQTNSPIYTHSAHVVLASDTIKRLWLHGASKEVFTWLMRSKYWPASCLTGGVHR